jgi:hypothetical protein
MNPAANAITALYRLEGDAFDQRFTIIATNIGRQLLEDFVRAPAIHSDVEELLGDLSAAVIQTQKVACRDANITEEQKRDFADRLDQYQADAVIAIRDSYETYQERSSVQFQLEAARRLGLPVAN